jgi:hypothetical protein
MAVDKDRLYKKLDHVGEHGVRENLANGVYGENRRGLVEDWLEQFQDHGEAEAIEEEVLGSGREASRLAREENPLTTSETSPDQWYRRPLGILGAAAH